MLQVEVEEGVEQRRKVRLERVRLLHLRLLRDRRRRSDIRDIQDWMMCWVELGRTSGHIVVIDVSATLVNNDRTTRRI